jgi:Mg2+ and Co2+ transporter CorA
MTNPNANSNNCLDRIEQAIEANSRQIADNDCQIANNSRQIAENTAAINTLIRATTQQQRNFEMMLLRFNRSTEIREMQSEVRGLQTENRRILEELQQRRNGNRN